MASVVLTTACGASDDDPAASDPAPATRPSTSTTVDVAPATFLDDVGHLVRRHAYYADQVDWDAWDASLPRVLADAEDPSDTYDAVHDLLAGLDRHSRFRPLAPDPEGPDHLSAGQAPSGEVDDGIGRLTLPTVPWGPEQDAGADYVAAAWDALDRAACGWAVDLRGEGGDAWTLAMALAPLIGPGPAFGFRYRDGTTDMVTIDDDGSLDGGGLRHLPVPEGLTIPPDRSDAPVAVIHSVTTASAHEFAVLAFTGRDATRTFGAPTNGLPTAREAFPLPNGSVLMLTTGLGVDRTGAAHDSALLPDEPVNGTRVRPPPLGDTDPALDAARHWLATQPACAPTS